MEKDSLFDYGHIEDGSAIYKDYLDLAPQRQSNNKLHDTNMSNKSSFFRDSFTDDLSI